MPSSSTVVVPFSPDAEVAELGKAEEAEGKLERSGTDDKLMHTVLQGDRRTIDQAMLLDEAISRGLQAFHPDLLFEQLVRNFSIARQLYGDKLIRLLTGYEPGSIERNLKIPEFLRALRKRVEERVAELKDSGLLDGQGAVAEKGVELVSLALLMQELDILTPKGSIGERVAKRTAHYGERDAPRPYRKGDRYRDLDLRRSIRHAIRRGHDGLAGDDLVTDERRHKGAVHVIYALDASASMRGDKIETCRRAGIALAYKAVREKDKVGLVVFGSEVKDAIPPTDDFGHLIHRIAAIRASKQTDFLLMIRKAIELYPPTASAKHLVILTDALPTAGVKPEEETLRAVSEAAAADITVSIVGIQLDSKGRRLAERMARIGRGRLYLVRDLKELGRIVLDDYDATRAAEAA
jgi:Mg-chelatase subunit ChlD